MQKKQALKFGAILVLESVTRRQESFDTMAEEKYTILYEGKVLYKNLTQEEFFDRMDDLSIEFYQKGTPHPSKIETRISKFG